jgi:hypothetical protein
MESSYHFVGVYETIKAGKKRKMEIYCNDRLLALSELPKWVSLQRLQGEVLLQR